MQSFSFIILYFRLVILLLAGTQLFFDRSKHEKTDVSTAPFFFINFLIDSHT